MDPKPVRSNPVRVTSAAIAALVFSGVAAGCAPNPSASAQSSAHAGPDAPATASQVPSAPSGPAGDLQNEYRQVVAEVLPSVVQITNGSGLGSGVLFDGKGDIVTNAHVVGDARTFQVQLANNPASLPASLVGTYAPDDLAVIHLDQPPSGLVPARFGDSAKLQIGDIVLAMGNPLGLTGSVTNGIVSAIGRVVTEPARPGAPGATLPQAIQTSAAINPGNSGGALVNLSGQVIGIPSLAALDPETGGSAAPGIGFAIPSNVVTDIAGQLVANKGHVVNSHRAALGIGVVSVLDQQGLPSGVGVAEVVPGGPADHAGIKVGSVITNVDNHPVRSSSDLSAVLAGLDPGKAVQVSVSDATGREVGTVTVTLGQLPGT